MAQQLEAISSFVSRKYFYGKTFAHWKTKQSHLGRNSRDHALVLSLHLSRVWSTVAADVFDESSAHHILLYPPALELLQAAAV